MDFYIKKWPNRNVTLMTSFGQVLSNFESFEEAIAVCSNWSNQYYEEITIHTENDEDLREYHEIIDTTYSKEDVLKELENNNPSGYEN